MASTPDTAIPQPQSRATRWLAMTLAAVIAFNVLVIAAYLAIGAPRKAAFQRTGWSVVSNHFHGDYGDDSFGPMGRAYLRATSREDKDIYGLFFDERRKFQYPPTSLLVFKLLPSSWLSPKYFELGEKYTTLKGPPLKILRASSELALLLTLVASIMIMESGLSRLVPGGSGNAGNKLLRTGLAALLGLSFYPLLKAHDLGQVQVFLNALTAVAVLAHLRGWRTASGICLGICCLFKPQYGVIVIWALIRRHWRLLAGFMATVVPVGLVSLAVFGWTNHLRYVEVIGKIARLGETYWPNQCFNGFVNRLLGNGDPVNFSAFDFAPYHPLVHAVTVITSLVILGLALFRRKSEAATNPTLDLGVIIASATLASPVAWEHHYGSFLPLFALALPACLQPQLPLRILGLVLGASFLAMNVEVFAADSYFKSPWRGWVASHLFLGALLFFGLLLYLRWTRGTADPYAVCRKADMPATADS